MCEIFEVLFCGFGVILLRIKILVWVLKDWILFCVSMSFLREVGG